MGNKNPIEMSKSIFREERQTQNKGAGTSEQKDNWPTDILFALIRI